MLKYILTLAFFGFAILVKAGNSDNLNLNPNFRISSYFIDTEYVDSTNTYSSTVCICFRDTFTHRKIQSFRIGISERLLGDWELFKENGCDVTNSDSVVIDKTKLKFYDQQRDIEHKLRGSYKVDGYMHPRLKLHEMKIPPNVKKMIVYLYPSAKMIKFHVEDQLMTIDSVAFEVRKERMHQIDDRSYDKVCYDQPSFFSKTISEGDWEMDKETKKRYANFRRYIYLDEILYFNVCVYYKDGRKECTDYKFEYQPNVESVINIW
jgi:hypothetical protein